MLGLLLEGVPIIQCISSAAARYSSSIVMVARVVDLATTTLNY